MKRQEAVELANRVQRDAPHLRVTVCTGRHTVVDGCYLALRDPDNGWDFIMRDYTDWDGLRRVHMKHWTPLPHEIPVVVIPPPATYKTTREAAAFLGLSIGAMKQHGYRGTITKRKHEGRSYYDITDLDTYRSQRRAA